MYQRRGRGGGGGGVAQRPDKPPEGIKPLHGQGGPTTTVAIFVVAAGQLNVLP